MLLLRAAEGGSPDGRTVEIYGRLLQLQLLLARRISKPRREMTEQMMEGDEGGESE